MQGVITTRELVTSASVIINEFGMATYLRCLTAVLLRRRNTTFLEVAMRARCSCSRESSDALATKQERDEAEPRSPLSMYLLDHEQAAQAAIKLRQARARLFEHRVQDGCHR